jgi:hypothetical protein
LIVIFLFPSINSTASEDNLKLKLQKGQTISIQYKFHKKTDHRPGTPTMIYEAETQWNLDVDVIQKVHEDKLIIAVRLQRYIFNNYANQSPEIHFDSMFPPDETGSAKLKFPTIFYETLCNLNIKMGLDLVKNELVLLEIENLDNEVSKLLSNKGLTTDETQKTKKQIIEKIDEIHETIDGYLLHFNNASFQTKDSVLVNKADYLVKKTDHQLKLSKKSTIKNEDGATEEHTSEATIDRNNGLIIGSVSKIVQPSFKKEDGRMSERKETEKTYILVKNSGNFSAQVTIKGFIEKPKSKQVQFQVLKDAALTEWEVFRTELDQDNRFSMNISIEKEGFIFMSNVEGERMIGGVPTKVIYAEPGDLIDFELLGEEKNQSMIHKGDKISENNCFITIRSGSIVTSNNISIGIGLPILTNNGPGMEFKALEAYADYVKTSHWDEVLKNSDLSLKFKTYFSKEMQMLKLQVACSILSYSRFFGDPGQNPELKQTYWELKDFVDQFQVCRYFNENGYFSRSAVSGYANFLFNKNLQYADPLSSENDYSLNFIRQNAIQKNPKQQANFLELILAGSPLIHEKVSLLKRNLSSSQQFNKYDKQVWHEMQKQLGEEIIKSSHDTALNQQVKAELAKAEEILSGEIYSRKLFLTPSGDSVSIADFLGEKPCVICPARDWGQNRYLFDDIAKKYPNVNAIIINEGKDFQKWNDYLQRGEPVAIQLFLDNNKRETMDKLFMGYNGFNNVIVFDKNGRLLDYEADINRIEKYIKQALNPPTEKKEPNKSTLYGIIWFMGGSMLVALIAFLIFKGRMRTKLKKQNQEKRLRELQLSAIRAQMNPHFLFNSLNSVQNLIQKNQGREAHLYLSDFAGLIRKVLKNSQHEEVSLAEELETLNQYIKLEQLRFDFEFEQVVDPEIDQNHFMVPSMILQPIAENAILHGLQHKKDNRKLRLEVLKKELAIQMNLEDNGIGMEASRKIESYSNGIGLNLNKERLKIMQEKYGGNYSFKLIELASENKEGTRVEITIPEEQ